VKDNKLATHNNDNNNNIWHPINLKQGIIPVTINNYSYIKAIKYNTVQRFGVPFKTTGVH